MLRLLLSFFFLCNLLLAKGNIIPVKNADELHKALKKAQPGDTLQMQNGEWRNAHLKLSAVGTATKPIVIMAQTAGKVFITGESSLSIGGEYIEVNGLYFKDGFAGNRSVVTFRTSNENLANNCRLTNTVIEHFNNAEKLNQNYWVALYGKNNRVDHNNFTGKMNLGVLMAVILDDERSRSNYHLIENNYFGARPPLGSNGGEIIRVGVSQHCQFDSKTQILNNFFEHCDGEVEIISIKSCKNVMRGNIFKESQGSLVLRHGDDNLVTENFFYGNGREESGGVRVINLRQTVKHNIFYKSRGTSFKAPLVVMNGVPNSPANRYVQVIDANITNNLFYNCSAMGFCEGSDAERSLPPKDVTFTENKIINVSDKEIYKAFDKIDGFHFANNQVYAPKVTELYKGFSRKKQKEIPLTTGAAIDSLMTDVKSLSKKIEGLRQVAGASWFEKTTTKPIVYQKVNCATTDEVIAQLQNNEAVEIILTNKQYALSEPFIIRKPVKFKSSHKDKIKLSITHKLAAFLITGNGLLTLEKINWDGSAVNTPHFISSDTAALSNQYRLTIADCSFENFGDRTICKTIFYAFKSMKADSVILYRNKFVNNHVNLLVMKDETDNKGYYNAEHIFIQKNNFNNWAGSLLTIYRGGNDESTLGPNLVFTQNIINNAQTNDTFIQLHGVQKTKIEANLFKNCVANPLIAYKDIVRAKHLLTHNEFDKKANIETNQFVQTLKNKYR